ncbi:MAG: type II secretion system protein [Verrucomicrobiia bacterium]
MKKNVISRSGFTLIEVMIVSAIIGLLASVALPNWVRARVTSQAKACINNLKQIDAAKQQWAFETGRGPGTAVVATDIQPYLGRGADGTPARPVCPADSGGTIDSSYTLGNVDTPPICNVQGAAQQPDPSLAHVLP